MIRRICVITVVVEDQEEALQWYVENLGFEKRTDQKMGADFRWVTVAPPDQKEVEITLANWKWYGDHTKNTIGKNPVVVLLSSNCKEDYKVLKAKVVKFASPPKKRP